MTTEPDKFNGYFEVIEDFDFRVEGAIKIPKEVRKFAYTLSVDIEIQSTIGNDYLNGKSSPAHGFFGYVVLVFRDYSAREIPISLARQNLYYGRVDEAYTNWYSLYLAAMANANLLAVSQLQLVPIGEAVGLEVGAPLEQTCLDWSGFVELPLREVYVKTRFGTRFKLEVSRWEPIPANYGGCAYDGESKIIDDEDKDDGLPDETQPQTSPDPKNPYDGFPPASSAEELGNYFNPKQGSVDNPNSDNEPSEDIATALTEGYYIQVDWSFIDFNPCRIRTARLFRGAPLGSSIRVERLTAVGSCGSLQENDERVSIVDRDGNLITVLGNAFTRLPVVGEIKYGFLPSDIAEL